MAAYLKRHPGRRRCSRRPRQGRMAVKRCSPLDSSSAEGGIDQTANMYIGGQQARPDSGYSRPVHGPDGVLGEVGEGNRKDIRNAGQEAARAALGWGGTTTAAHNRAQILFFLAENLDYRRKEFAGRLRAQTGACRRRGRPAKSRAAGRAVSSPSPAGPTSTTAPSTTRRPAPSPPPWSSKLGVRRHRRARWVAAAWLDRAAGARPRHGQHRRARSLRSGTRCRSPTSTR